MTRVIRGLDVLRGVGGGGVPRRRVISCGRVVNNMVSPVFEFTEMVPNAFRLVSVRVWMISAAFDAGDLVYFTLRRGRERVTTYAQADASERVVKLVYGGQEWYWTLGSEISSLVWTMNLPFEAGGSSLGFTGWTVAVNNYGVYASFEIEE